MNVLVFPGGAQCAIASLRISPVSPHMRDIPLLPALHAGVLKQKTLSSRRFVERKGFRLFSTCAQHIALFVPENKSIDIQGSYKTNSRSCGKFCRVFIAQQADSAVILTLAAPKSNIPEGLSPPGNIWSGVFTLSTRFSQ